MLNMPDRLSEDLPERMSNLDAAAFEEFANAFLPALGEFFQRGGATEAEAEDLAAACTSDICLQIARYRRYPGVSFDSWVFSIARHKRADWQRKHYRCPTPVPLDELSESELVLPGTLALGELDVDQDVRGAVRDALNRLSRLQRTILEMIYKGSARNSKEIGEILGIPAGTVRVHHLRARQRVKSMLQHDPRIKSRLRRVAALT